MKKEGFVEDFFGRSCWRSFEESLREWTPPTLGKGEDGESHPPPPSPERGFRGLLRELPMHPLRLARGEERCQILDSCLTLT